jgi:hypothetical protein
MQNAECGMQNKNAPGGVKFGAEDVESAIATVEHIKLMYEKDFSIDWQIETGLWVPEGIDNPVRHYKDLIVKELERTISILASLL